MSEDNSGPTKKDSISPEASQIPPMLDEVAKRAIDLYLDPKPQAKKEEALRSIVHCRKERRHRNPPGQPQRNPGLGQRHARRPGFRSGGLALGVQQMIELGELLANRALDIVEPRL